MKGWRTIVIRFNSTTQIWDIQMTNEVAVTTPAHPGLLSEKDVRMP